MLDLGQLGFSCPVNWKQSSFVGLGLLISNNDYQVHIDDYKFNKGRTIIFPEGGIAIGKKLSA